MPVLPFVWELYRKARFPFHFSKETRGKNASFSIIQQEAAICKDKIEISRGERRGFFDFFSQLPRAARCPPVSVTVSSFRAYDGTERKCRRLI
jgi:hypothetical protein